MSTKIFPFKPRKIKPPKAPDPEIGQLFEKTKALQEHAKAERAERHRIMAELYAEDLERRAARLIKDLPLCPCCGLPMSKYVEAVVKQKLGKD